ncbi:MAG TPA: cytochrome ubiquinol oxidase subunit I [Vicinamibacterales bacterium]|jgi:cytochrome d ubiquinol oxidase subunit I
MDLLYARWQMGLSLGFHIVFAVIGMAMPLMMVVAEVAWLRTGRSEYRELVKRWSTGTAILFAVGAVSGTVLSFELGLLWPTFMEFAGPIIGMPFSLEGFAFFLEAIFLGLYLYGWQRLGAWAHVFAGVMVALGGALSGIFVVTANSWMNTPAGFRMVNGEPVDVDPIAAMLNPAAGAQVVHMMLAAYAAVGVAVAGIHARLLLRDSRDPFHRRAFAIALLVGLPSAVLQPLSGDWAARVVARTQPAKLAALEGQFVTETHAPVRLGGVPDPDSRETRYALEIPGGLSFLAYGDPSARVVGLNDIPRDLWPPVTAVHLAFQIMVAIGVWLAALAGWATILWWRGRLFTSRAFLRAMVVSTTLGFVAIEAGWIVTELGRQPWIIQGVLKTADAVTPMPGLVFPFALFTVVYIGLAVVVVAMIRRTILDTAPPADARG